MLGEFDYFTPTLIQSAIVSEYDDVISPVNAINPDAAQELNTLEFNIPGATDLYRDLNNSTIMLRIKVTKPDGTALPANTLIQPVNLQLHSMFSNVAVTLCGKEISEKDSMYAYRAFLETLLTYKKSVLDTRGSIEGWLRDDVDAMDDLTSHHSTAGNIRPLVKAKHLLIAESREWTLIGRPHVDLFQQKLDIPPNCNMNIRFVPAKAGFALMHAGAGGAYKILVLSAKMFIRTKKVNPEVVLAHKAMLERANMRFPMSRVTVNRYGIASGFKSVSIPLNFPTKLPKRIVIGFVKNSAVSGTPTENPYNFDNHKVSELSLSVNGVETPALGLTMDFAKDNYQRAYLNTLAALELDTGNDSISITPSDFKAAFALFGFKIAPGPVDGTVFSAANSVGSLVVNVTFAEAPAATLDMIVYSETPSVLEIDKLNAVTIV